MMAARDCGACVRAAVLCPRVWVGGQGCMTLCGTRARESWVHGAGSADKPECIHRATTRMQDTEIRHCTQSACGRILQMGSWGPPAWCFSSTRERAFFGLFWGAHGAPLYSMQNVKRAGNTQKSAGGTSLEEHRGPQAAYLYKHLIPKIFEQQCCRKSTLRMAQPWEFPKLGGPNANPR